MINNFKCFLTCNLLAICLAVFASTLVAQQTRVVPPPSNDLANRIGCTLTWNGQGFVVGQVSGGAAQQAGLETGDVIVQVGQNRMQNGNSFRTALANTQGGRVQLTVINVRNGQYVQTWMPCPTIVPPVNITPPPVNIITPPPVVDPPPQQQPVYTVKLYHPVTGGLVFNKTVTGTLTMESRKSYYERMHWRIWRFNGIEEDTKYRRFDSAREAHNYNPGSSLLGFYTNRVRQGRVVVTQIR